ncbi:hypothetical protein [Streptomyces sp. st170]|uniref:hypothetical protein n=1 Tax=Streptomyces sp. st170 TaxID=1828058 RepID=UPI000BF01320|nr:hypothetical protein [Streptomyces sp. st170]
MREKRELAGTRVWTQRPYGGHTDQELTRLIATGPVDARREDRGAAAADGAAASLLQEIEDAATGGTTLGRIELAPIYVLLDQADERDGGRDRRRAPAQQNRSYQPPSPSRSGPKRGR